MSLVLTYHRVFPGHHIDPELFEWHLRTLLRQFEPVTLKKIVEVTQKEVVEKKRRFAIVFDDGWADNFLYAYPILKKYKVPATIFIPTQFITEHRTAQNKELKEQDMDTIIAQNIKHGTSEEFLTWQELHQMEPLVQVESHGHAHLNYLENSLVEVKNDLKCSLRIIAKKMLKKSTLLAWPYGAYNKKVMEIAKHLGFKACFTTLVGNITPKDDSYELKRFEPPRSKLWFRIAIAGNIGISFYRSALMFKKLLFSGK